MGINSFSYTLKIPSFKSNPRLYEKHSNSSKKMTISVLDTKRDVKKEIKH